MTRRILELAELHRAMRRKRIFRDRRNPIDIFNDNDLVRRYKFPREDTMFITDLIAPEIEQPTRHVLLPYQQVVIALQCYATGTFQMVVGDPLQTPQIVEASEKAQQHQLPSPTKELLLSIPQDIVKEGIIEFMNHAIPQIDIGHKSTRASDRSWKPVWAVLRGHALYFYKDKKDANHSPSALSEDHAPINVKSCIVDIAYDYTKKKNVFRLSTFGANEFLFQADDNNDMLFWIQAIQENSNPDDDQKGIGNQNLILRKSSAVSSDHYQLSVKDQVARLSPQFTQKEESSPKSKTWRGKMVKSLKKFHGTSSTAQLHQIEGTTIGICLEECPATVNNEVFVPILVELCTKIVEAKGLEVIGIYRIPGNNASVAALQDAVNRGFENLNLQDPRWNDVNVISSLLKAFFRQLPEPLFTSELYPLFIEANKLEDNNQRIITLKKLVHELPDYHYETLQHLMFHLKKVVHDSNINKMEARNLAIVFGPNLVRTADNNMVTMVTDMSHQCKIVETVLSNVDWFFSIEEDGYNQPPISSFEAVQQTTSHTDLLLGNIQRVEGMSGGHHGEVCTRDIVSNIISAANRKVKIKSSKKDFDERDIDREIEMRHQKLRRGSAPSESLSAKSGFKTHLTDWIKSDGVDSTNSTLSSSSRTLSSQTLSEDAISYQSTDTKPSTESLDCDKNIKTNNLGNVKDRYIPSSNPKVISNESNPPYTTLSPSTQERIKRFETETKAILQRDLHTRRSRHDHERHDHERHRHELQRQRIEMEWQRAKRDLEQEDFLDELADNPSDISKKISDFAYKISDLNSKPDSAVQPKSTETSDYSSLGTSSVPVSSSTSSNLQSSDGRNINPKFLKRRNQEKSKLPPISSDHKKILPPRTRKGFAEASMRRGKSAENFIDLETEVPAYENAKRNLSFKHGGSLDSLRENYVPKDNSISNNSTSDDGQFHCDGRYIQRGLRSYQLFEFCEPLRLSEKFNTSALEIMQPRMREIQDFLTSTLDSKLQVISSLGNRKFMPQPPSLSSSKPAAPLPALMDSHLNYRDPSLYRSNAPLLNGTNAVTVHELKQTTPPIHRNIYRDPSMHRQNRPNNRKGIVGNEHFLLHFNDDDILPALALQGNPEERVKPVAKAISEEEKPFRQEYTTMRATISQRKNSVTMSPTSTAIINLTLKEKRADETKFPLKKSSSRDDLNNNKCFKKQKCSTTRMPLKRRHTVAGIQDFDKFKWLLSNENSRFSKEPRLSAWEQLRPVENLPPEQRSLKSWMIRERLRTSSPDLFHLKQQSSSGDCLSVFQNDIGRRRHFPQPSSALESLV
ncbi:Rho GTPase-activating protein 21 [Nymphon striatum]|nr:Rho GTPase-activating protein 21 [Nymphon striatum]